MAFDAHISADRAVLWKAAWAILFIGMLIVLTGCAVDDVCVISYTSSAEVKPPENVPMAVRSSPFPWDVVLSGVSDLFTGARKKAIEEKVGYREHRSFTLFRLKRAEDSRSGCQNKPIPTSCVPAASAADRTHTVSQSDDPDDATRTETQK